MSRVRFKRVARVDIDRRSVQRGRHLERRSATPKCAKCGRIIPAHLAERWDGVTDEQASQEWRQNYRGTAPSTLDG